MITKSKLAHTMRSANKLFTSEQLKELEMGRESRQISLEVASVVPVYKTGAFSC